MMECRALSLCVDKMAYDSLGPTPLGMLLLLVVINHGKSYVVSQAAAACVVFIL